MRLVGGSGQRTCVLITGIYFPAYHRIRRVITNYKETVQLSGLVCTWYLHIESGPRRFLTLGSVDK